MNVFDLCAQYNLQSPRVGNLRQRHRELHPDSRLLLDIAKLVSGAVAEFQTARLCAGTDLLDFANPLGRCSQR